MLVRENEGAKLRKENIFRRGSSHSEFRRIYVETLKEQGPSSRKLKSDLKSLSSEQFAAWGVRWLMERAVLIVEDEFLLRADAVGVMEDLGFIVYEAANADEAIGLLELHADIRVVFTDINMPGSMDGLKLAHYIRGRWPPVKLILTSGQTRPLTEDMPIGTTFVGKPYQLESVADNLRAMIG